VFEVKRRQVMIHSDSKLASSSFTYGLGISQRKLTDLDLLLYEKMDLQIFEFIVCEIFITNCQDLNKKKRIC
jgi:hypothetical protein